MGPCMFLFIMIMGNLPHSKAFWIAQAIILSIFLYLMFESIWRNNGWEETVEEIKIARKEMKAKKKEEKQKRNG